MAEKEVIAGAGRTHLRGALLGIGSAALFGASAPCAKRLLLSSGPLTVASLLYLGAGFGLSLIAPSWHRARDGSEAALRRSDLPLLLGGVLTGGILGPLLMMIGFQRVSAVSGSLLMNLEPPLTIALAVVLFGEHLGWRQGGASILILLGAAIVGAGPGQLRSEWIGVAALAASCLSWAIDTNLSQRLSLRDPVASSRFKGLAGGSCTMLLALGFGEHLPSGRGLAAALGLGAVCYGISAVLFVRALRDLGAARVAAYFATAPFFGVLAAIPVMGERVHGSDLAAMAVMAGGVVLLLRERHDHPHDHEELFHDHAHLHDEHHRHEHAPHETMPALEAARGGASASHSHPHRHAPVRHAHPHAPDHHHRHSHD